MCIQKSSQNTTGCKPTSDENAAGRDVLSMSERVLEKYIHAVDAAFSSLTRTTGCIMREFGKSGLQNAFVGIILVKRTFKSVNQALKSENKMRISAKPEITRENRNLIIKSQNRVTTYLL